MYDSKLIFERDLPIYHFNLWILILFILKYTHEYKLEFLMINSEKYNTKYFCRT